MPILQGLGRGARITLLIYLVAKAADMTITATGRSCSREQGESVLERRDDRRVIVPIVLYSLKSVRESVNGLLVTSGLVLFGVVLNRFDVNFFASGTDKLYFRRYGNCS